MNMPSDYLPGYERARAVDPDVTSRYIEHTTLGDPEADELMEALADLGSEGSRQVLQLAMDAESPADLRELPPVVRDFFEEIAVPPDWVDFAAYTPGIRMFHRNSRLVLGAMVGGTLVEGFSTNISKSFFITGRVRDQGVRRLKQNNRHMVEIFLPGGMQRSGDGWKLSVRIRLVHAQVRRLLNGSEDWDHEAWGTPISAAHVGYAITAFSARLLKHLRSLGAVFDEEERASFLQVWRYSGYLMGIPETILFKDEDEALRLYDIGTLCEPDPEMEAVAMASALVNSAPLIIGIDEPEERQRLAKYVFTISRALIGNKLADQLHYPKSPTRGVLAWFRMQERYHRLLYRLFPKRVQASSFSRFTSLLDASGYDEAGITYALPDHVHAEESSRW
ncbi:MAG: DUF2236 domain-containing protein [Chloroflexi bacterium]|nr:DUF2236 domain-containing protein [Chloroflexota bacterium]MYE47014.1 DUF2236 domain-containing protein [Chloroflexota bacterium]